MISDIHFNRAVIGPVFRKQAQAFMSAIKELPPHQMEKPPKTIILEGSEVEIPENSFTPKFSYLEEGEKVDVIAFGDVIVTIAKTA